MLWWMPSARQKAENQITKKREQRTVEISGLGQVKQGFEALNSGLVPATGLTGLVASRTGTALDIEIDDMAKASAFSHSVLVDGVAAGQTLVFDGFSGETASVGTGSLTLPSANGNPTAAFPPTASAATSRSISPAAMARWQAFAMRSTPPTPMSPPRS